MLLETLKTEINNRNNGIREVADISGIPYQTIWNWVTGRAVAPLDKAEKIFAALGYEIVLKKIDGQPTEL
jgi:predicted transcriptional regulator